MKSKSINQVVNSNLCFGCGACSYVVPKSIKMENKVKYGMRLVLMRDIINNEIVLKVCPSIQLSSPTFENTKSFLKHLRSN